MSSFSLCVEHLPNYYVRHSLSFDVYRYHLDPLWSFRRHLSRARPTEMIFHLLRSIPSERLLPAYPVGMGIVILEVIVKWLQVSVSEWN